jgi:quercetin dioxygenase-like cupin family protein
MATPEHVPAGNYPAPAPVHQIDLEEAADRLLAKLAGHRRQSENLAREAGVSVVMMAMEAGNAIKEHSAKGAVSVQLLRGHAVLTAQSKSYELRPGQLVLFQPEVRHDLHAEEQSIVVLTVSGGA